MLGDRREARRGLRALRLGVDVRRRGHELAQGDEERRGASSAPGIEAHPDDWQGYFNLACVEAQLGDRDAALEQLERAAELDREARREVGAEGRPTLESLRERPARF